MELGRRQKTQHQIDFQNIISWSSTGIVGGFDHIFLIIFGQGKKAQR